MPSSLFVMMTALALATLGRADHCQWRNSLLWESERAGASDWPPLVGASAVFTVHVGLGVSAADRATGEIQWFVAGDSFVGGCAEATADAIVCPRSSGVVLLNAANGTIVASYDTDGAPVPYGAPLTANGFVFFGTTSGKVHAVSAADLAEQWVKDLISGAIVSSPALWGPHIVVGSVNGVVFKMDPLTGEVQGSYSAGVSASRGVFSGIVVDGVLAYINLNVDSNNFAAVNLNTMSEAWRVTLSQGSVASVTPAVDVDNNAVYIATVEGLLLALALDDGSTQWTAQLRHDARVRGPLGVVDGNLVAVVSSEGFFLGYDFHSQAHAFSLRMERSTMLSAPAFDGTDAYFAGSTILYKMSAVCEVRS